MTAEVAVSGRSIAELRALVADAQARSTDWTADDVAAWGGAGPVAVRRRRGVAAAHYELIDGTAVIAVPERDTWALRELVVLHELAHHLSHADPPHGPDFVAAHIELCTAIMGPEVGLVLRMVYAKEGVV